MHFEPSELYHIYNRGNNKQPIFFSRANYQYFLKKLVGEWIPLCDILNFCLMPNHFHVIAVPNIRGCQNIILKGKEMHLQQLSKTIGKTLSSYTRAINIEQNRTGSLFQKKTKAKHIIADHLDGYSLTDYLTKVIHYTHYNPVHAGLVQSAEDWEFSSARDYANLRHDSFCNRDLFFHISGMSQKDFSSRSRQFGEESIFKPV